MCQQEQELWRATTPHFMELWGDQKDISRGSAVFVRETMDICQMEEG